LRNDLFTKTFRQNSTGSRFHASSQQARSAKSAWGLGDYWKNQVGREEENKQMRTGKLVASALIAGLIAGATMSSVRVFAQENPGAAAPPAAGADQKVKQLEGCIDHFKQARKGWSQEPNTQADYTEKIAHARRMIAKLKAGQDYPQDKIDSACKSPGSAPY
jgi:hypothetical protein